MESMATIQFKGYKILKCNFFLEDQMDRGNIKSRIHSVGMNFKASYRKSEENNRFNIFLDTTIKGKSSGEIDLVTLNLIMRGDFEYDGKLNETLIKLNGTAIVFPYLRSIITNITANFGIDPIILPVFNIKKMIENQKIEKLWEQKEEKL